MPSVQVRIFGIAISSVLPCLHWPLEARATLLNSYRILSPITSKEGDLQMSYGFICDQCHFRPGLDDIDDYIRTHRISSRTGERASKNLRWPVRCRSCERNKKRFQRMQRRLEKIWDASYNQSSPKYKRPKLITFALPSEMTENPSGEEFVQRLDKLLPKARKILTDNGVRGGTYVIECTTRFVVADPQGNLVFAWKHHAHVHMVAVAPFVHRTKLKSFCESLMPIGLGRINYVAPQGKYKDAVRQVARYIGKYLVKDNRNSRTFGVMRGKSTPPIPSDKADKCSEPRRVP